MALDAVTPQGLSKVSPIRIKTVLSASSSSWIMLAVIGWMTLFSAGSQANRVVASNETGMWTPVLGGFRFISDISYINSTNIWASSPQGIVHYDGAQWNVRSHSFGEVFTIDMIDRDNGFAISESGLLEWNGKTWRLRDDFNGVAAIRHTDVDHGWALVRRSDRLGLIRIDGETLIDTKIEIAKPYVKFQVTDDDTAWILFEDQILRYREGEARTFALEKKPLLSIDMLNSSSGWVVGGSCSREGEGERFVYRLDEDSWNLIIDTHGKCGLDVVAAIDSRHAIAAGIDNSIVSFVEDKMVTLRDMEIGADITTAVRIPNDEAVVLASTHVDGAKVRIVKNNNIETIFGGTITALDVNSMGGYAIRDERSIIKMESHGDEVGLVAEDARFDTRIHDVAMLNDGTAWVGGSDGSIYCLIGNEWRRQSSVIKGDVLRLMVSPSDSLYALAYRSDGIGVYRVDAVNQVLIYDGPERDIIDISVDQSEQIWLLSRTGVTVVSSSEATRHIEYDPVWGDMFAVFAVSNQKAWLGGDGMILRLKDGQWRLDLEAKTDMNPQSKRSISRLTMDRDGVVWAGADSASLYEYDGDGWSFHSWEATTTPSGLYYSWRIADMDVVETSSGSVVWIVGASNTILRYQSLSGPHVTPSPRTTDEQPTPTVFPVPSLTPEATPFDPKKCLRCAYFPIARNDQH